MPIPSNSWYVNNSRGLDAVESGKLLQALPAAVYTTDASGRINFYNEAAVLLWGFRPELGKAEWCGSWRLYWPDGRPMAHDECPMAQALKEGRQIIGAEAVAERPDGSRIPFLAYPTPLWDGSGELVGAVNTLIDITDRKAAELSAVRLAAIVESCDEAIVSKDLDGIITSWNSGAERLFGYAADEIIGRPALILIPARQHDEETRILSCIRRGARVEPYETVRRRKDGSLVEVLLTVSPIKSRDGQIIGASKIARDITERRQAQEQQRLLMREMNHRIKNLFALASGVITLNARSVATPQELAEAVRSRLNALARAHDLTLPLLCEEPTNTEGRATTLADLVRTILAPYVLHDHVSVSMQGPDIPVVGRAVTSMALLLHEIATNAGKYGALASREGRIAVEWAARDDELVLTWQERGGPPVSGTPETEGFGSMLVKLTVTGQLSGTISHDWDPAGLTVILSMPVEMLQK